MSEKFTTSELAELLMLARVCKYSEFILLMDALGHTLRVPCADIDATVKRLREIRKDADHKNKIPVA